MDKKKVCFQASFYIQCSYTLYEGRRYIWNIHGKKRNNMKTCIYVLCIYMLIKWILMYTGDGRRNNRHPAFFYVELKKKIKNSWKNSRQLYKRGNNIATLNSYHTPFVQKPTILLNQLVPREELP